MKVECEERADNFMIRIENFSAVQFTLVSKLLTIGLNRIYSTPVFCLSRVFGVFVIFWVSEVFPFRFFA